MSFGFEGMTLPPSIETRKTKGEEYSAIEGSSARAVYVVSDERDGASACNYRGRRIRVSLQCPARAVRDVFRDYYLHQ
jgi:hypothetical protein